MSWISTVMDGSQPTSQPLQAASSKGAWTHLRKLGQLWDNFSGGFRLGCLKRSLTVPDSEEIEVELSTSVGTASPARPPGEDVQSWDSTRPDSVLGWVQMHFSRVDRC